jgi:hypothetical protein
VLPGASDKRISDRAADTTTASLTVKGFSTRSIAELGGTFHSIRVAANPGAITSKVPGPFGTCGSTNSPFEWDFVLPEKLEERMVTVALSTAAPVLSRMVPLT